MGHALGAARGRTPQRPDVLMNAETDDNTNPVPDETDFANLLSLYGRW